MNRFPPLKSQAQINAEENYDAACDLFLRVVAAVGWLAVALAVVFAAGRLAKLAGVM